MDTDSIATEIIALERAALDRWGNGDPSGYLKISAPEVTYFDPYLERRIDGLEGLTARYEPLVGAIRIDHYELLSPKVQVYEGNAILTFNLVSHSGSITMHWNCTEVYRRFPQGWRIVHTHWAIAHHLQP